MGVRLSVGRKGQCWDNAVAESFFATIKAELLDRRAWPTRTRAQQAIFEWIEGWYNTRRRHFTGPGSDHGSRWDAAGRASCHVKGQCSQTVSLGISELGRLDQVDLRVWPVLSGLE